MNRVTGVALVVAAVIGVAGGTYAASLGIDDPQQGADDRPSESRSPRTQSSPAEPSPSPSATSVPNTPAQLLYMSDTEIRDGYTRVPVKFDIDKVSALVRIRGGWLVTESTSDHEPTFVATVVTPDGDTRELGSFRGHWDINEDGTEFVALERGGTYWKYDLLSGDNAALAVEEPVGFGPGANAAFAGDDVLTAWNRTDELQTVVRRTTPDGKTSELTPDGVFAWTASPRGLLMAGEYAGEESTCLAGGKVAGDHSDWWTTCAWRSYGFRPQYSPNGEQLLVVPSDTDGFGPGTYAVLDSGTGKKTVEVDVPEWTRTAEWGDNNEVFVLGARDGDDPGAIIYRCQLGKKCTEERVSAKPLVLGAGL